MSDEAIQLKAQQLYEKLAGWHDVEPGIVDDVLKSDATRIELVKKAEGALAITVLAPDQFSVRVPRGTEQTMTESQMFDAVRRWGLSTR